MSTFSFMSHTQIILLQGQHCMYCSPMDCLHLLIIHSFSGSSPLPSKALNGSHVSSRNMRELDCMGMRRMTGLNFDVALSFVSLISLLLDGNTKPDLLPAQTRMRKSRTDLLGNFTLQKTTLGRCWQVKFLCGRIPVNRKVLLPLRDWHQPHIFHTRSFLPLENLLAIGLFPSPRRNSNLFPQWY